MIDKIKKAILQLAQPVMWESDGNKIEISAAVEFVENKNPDKFTHLGYSSSDSYIIYTIAGDAEIKEKDFIYVNKEKLVIIKANSFFINGTPVYVKSYALRAFRGNE